MKQIEICCGSYDDCLQAHRGGAHRVELNSALYMGGLTPSVGSLRLTKQHTDLQVMVMIRPRGAGFCYGEADYQCMLEDARIFLEEGADGIVFGCLHPDGTIHEEQTRQMIELTHQYGKEAVFHRAFDCTPDPFKAIETLIQLKADRILTSGQQPKAMQGKELLKQLQERYGNQIELLAGSGMNAENAKELMDYTGITQVHSSCKTYYPDTSTAIAQVDYAYLSGEHQASYDGVSSELVKALVEAVNKV